MRDLIIVVTGIVAIAALAFTVGAIPILVLATTLETVLK